MKAMDEFQSVLVIAALILAACALIDLPLAGPEPGAAAADSASSGGRRQPTLQVRLPVPATTAW